MLVNVKRLHPLAGQRHLLDAMPAVLRAHPDTELVICGTGALRPELEAQAAALGIAPHVRFAGLVDNEIVADYNRAADVFVLPSLLEALPTVAVEALACGTPVVSADHPGGVELHGLFGADVAVVPREDSASLAAALSARLADPRRTLPSTAIGLERHFRPAAVRAQYFALYAALAPALGVRLAAGARAMTAAAADPRHRRGDRRGRRWRGRLRRALRGRPGFVATLDNTPAPAVARGLHPTEFEAGGLSFAWTEGRVTLIFEGLDRSRPWTLSLRAKAGRGPGLPPPTATIGVDGTALATAPIGPQWQDVRVVLPTEARKRPTRITVDVAPTFVPGPADSRTLGMILDEVRLVPDGMPSPPGRAVTAAADGRRHRRRGDRARRRAGAVGGRPHRRLRRRAGAGAVDRRRAVRAPLPRRRPARGRRRRASSP